MCRWCQTFSINMAFHDGYGYSTKSDSSATSGMEAMLLNSNKEVVITNDTDNIYGEPDSSFISKLDEINDLPKSARKLIYEAALMQLYLKPESFNKETPDEKRALANLKSVLAETKDNQPDSKWNQTVDAMLFKLDRMT